MQNRTERGIDEQDTIALCHTYVCKFSAIGPLSGKTYMLSLNCFLDKGRVVENVQKGCLCYLIIVLIPKFSKHFNHIEENIFDLIIII